MKRMTAIALTGTLLMGLLTGCGNSGADSDQAGESQTEATTNEAGDGEVYDVVMQWPTLGDTPAGLEDVEEAVNEITVPEIGCTVTLEPVNAYSLPNETSLAISSGEKLDLSLALFTGVGSLVNNGSIVPLDEYIDEYGEQIKETCDKRLAGGYYGDSLYGIPNAYINGEKYGYVCRTDLLEKYDIKIDPDKVYTMEELSDIFAKVKEGEGDGFYCVGGTKSTTELFESLYPYDALGATNAGGGLMLGDDFKSTTVENIFASEEYAEFADQMYDWAQKGYFIPDASTNTEQGAAQVKAGNVLGWFPGACSGGAEDYNAQTGMDMTIITTVEGYSKTTQFNSMLWCVPVTSEKPEKAVQFLNYIYENQEVCNLLQFGIEDVDYVVVEDNGTDKLIDFPEGLDSKTVPYYQNFGVYGNRLAWPIRVPNTIELNQKMREFDESITKFSPGTGYSFVVDDVSTEYSAVSAVINQYTALISTGAVDPDKELPEFINALQTAGIDTVIEENQRQFDEWYAKQK